MPLPTPSLDDRRFQDIVDQAKTLIPRYCPEWTDHNVSDPGVTLIELFAWMTDMLLYRVNQVPDKMYVKFLEVIGIRLEPPRSARAPITFYLSAPQPAEVIIPEGTEAATVRTETNPAIIFTTENDLTIRPPGLTGASTRSASDGSWRHHDLRQLQLPGQRLPMFSVEPASGDGFYLGFESDLSHHVIAMLVDCELAGGAGVDPQDPPIEWQVWQGGALRWATCEQEYDGTGGFNQPGEIVLHLPPMAQREIEGVDGYWLRCRLISPREGQGFYRVSPDLSRIEVESRGGTITARHATTVRNEQLGQSDGSAGQSLQLLHSPILARDASRDHLVVETSGGETEIWQEVRDFGDSGPEDCHYVLDDLDGSITLGPSLLQPDGTVYSFGKVPPKGSSFRFRRYQYGGGVGGNVPRGTISVLKTSIPYVARILNRQPAVGGRDAQSLEDARVRAPQTLRTRTRAVTAEDFEHLAMEVPGVARAHCLAPGSQPGDPSDPRPGQVFVIVLPHSENVSGEVPPDQLVLSSELRSAVMNYLDQRRLLSTSLDVLQPQYFSITVGATLRVAEGSDAALAADVQQEAVDTLYRYLNPFTGGPEGRGWPFGRPLHISEIYGLLQRTPGIDFVEDVRISVREPGRSAEPQTSGPRLEIPRHALICSGHHEVSVY